MLAVIAHAKRTPDEPADAIASPDIGLVAVSQRPLRDQPNEPSLLDGRELRRSPRRYTHLVDSLSELVAPVSPAHHGTRPATDATSHLVEREPFVQELECAATPRRTISRPRGEKSDQPSRRCTDQAGSACVSALSDPLAENPLCHKARAQSRGRSLFEKY
jgi:hypothetical protein